MIHQNPEFMRNVWLELTLQRLLAMPAILGLIFAICAFGSLEGAPGLNLPRLSVAAQALFIVITVFWGAKLAADSLTEEFAQATWDTQRLSGLGAWRMTTGKLLGGPVFAWYGGLLCLGVFIAAHGLNEPWALIRSVSLLLLTALAVHALSLLSCLRAWRKLPAALRQPRARNSGMILLLILLGPQAFTASHFLGSEDSGREVLWYGLSFGAMNFALICVMLAAFWSVFGLYRAMREELAFRDPPSGWLGFLLFLCVFLGGGFYGGEWTPHLLREEGLPAAVAHLGLCSVVAWLFAYLLLFQERKDWLRLRRLVSAWRAGERRRAYELTPRWLITLLFAAALALLFALLALSLLEPLRGIGLAACALALLAFLVRDAAVVLGLNFTRDQRRADSAAALYLGVLYLLVPALLAAAGLHLFLPAFFPFSIYEQPPWIIAGLFQAAAALDYARRRWRQLPQ